ncbi:DUF4266 domain-containing protein [Ferruginibacter sp.]|jgi:uncharacterized lipoprotein|uniref:DUF4266 domain-containing protein n=2 Tax=Ferruginibacter sp. TaxID=1940288 RepID=UPI001987A658|nr:DUF4266 domain-containing protein [Ferruginibacter sp.]MBC7627159.1 DUF4266 domain-containing protein [Ferruginibacter sp.]
MKKKSMTGIVLAILFVAGATSCTSVKEYQKSKLKDSEMGLAARKIEKTEQNFQSYREAASGANGGKTGGGCGCN